MLQAASSDFMDWRRLWNLKVPPNIKNFLWHCMRNILSVLDVLSSKGVVIGGGCSYCVLVTKTISHVLCECPLACDLWGAVDILQGLSLGRFVLL